MSDLYFVDSNVLIYRHDRRSPLKQAVSDRVLRTLWARRTGRLSAQVLHEFYNVTTRKLATPLTREVARQELRLLERWRPTPLSRAVRERAWSVEDRFGLSWWDSLVVGAAQLEGCRWLLSEDLQDGQDLDGVVVMNPYSRSDAEIFENFGAS